MSQVDNINVRLIVIIHEDDEVLNISTASSKSIILKKPDGELTTFTASFLTDGTDGGIYYDTVSGDLDQSGVYKIQGLILIDGGTYKSSIEIFKVFCNL